MYSSVSGDKRFTFVKVAGTLLTVEDRVTFHRRRREQRLKKPGGACRDLKKTVLTEGVACARVLRSGAGARSLWRVGGTSAMERLEE